MRGTIYYGKIKCQYRKGTSRVVHSTFVLGTIVGTSEADALSRELPGWAKAQVEKRVAKVNSFTLTGFDLIRTMSQTNYHLEDT